MNDVRPAIMPKAREDRLIIKDLPDETLVYDLNTDEAHCLNSTAAMVWKNCDGESSVDDVMHSLEQETGMAADTRVIWLALNELERFKLLDTAPAKPMALAGMSRRQLIRALGIAGVMLPAVVSIVSPVAVDAQSCVPGNNTVCIVGGLPCCAPRTCQPGSGGSPPRCG